MSILGDIIRGYSVLRSGEKKAFLKHLSILEQVELEEFEAESFEEAIVAGVKSEEQLLERAAELGVWTKKDEDDLEGSKWQVEKTESNAKKITNDLVREGMLSNIKDLKKNIQKQEEKREKVVGFSAESLATNKRATEMIRKSLFLDKKFKKKIKKEDCKEFIIPAFLKLKNFYDRDLMLNAAYEDMFFEVFVVQQKNPVMLFGKSLKDITLNQSRLLAFANGLLQKLKSIPNIPKRIMKDPALLFDYVDSEDHAKKMRDQLAAKDGFDDIREKQKKGEKIGFQDI